MEPRTTSPDTLAGSPHGLRPRLRNRAAEAAPAAKREAAKRLPGRLCRFILKDKQRLFLRSKTNTKTHAASEQQSRRGPRQKFEAVGRSGVGSNFLRGGCLDGSGADATATKERG